MQQAFRGPDGRVGMYVCACGYVQLIGHENNTRRTRDRRRARVTVWWCGPNAGWLKGMLLYSSAAVRPRASGGWWVFARLRRCGVRVGGLGVANETGEERSRWSLSTALAPSSWHQRASTLASQQLKG